jgi:hypothetical protein
MQYVETQTGMIIMTENPSLWTSDHMKGKHLPKAEGERRHKKQAREALLRILEKGDTVFCVLRSVSRSGMSRNIDFYVIKDNRPQYLTGYMAALYGRTIGTSSNHMGLKINGCGMDMGFHEVYNLARTLWPEGNPDRADRDGGYLLRSEWL